jgi:3-phenylpropionate/cinnamic acid dioxygenase small subunit
MVAETLVQELIDREAIRELFAHVAEALDNRDWALLRRLCANEVDTDYSAWGIAPQRMGADSLVGLFRASFWRPELRTQHLYTNFRIQVTSDTARVVFNFFGQHYAPGFAEGEESVLRGEYTATLQREGGDWRISGLVLRVFFTSGAMSMLNPAA